MGPLCGFDGTVSVIRESKDSFVVVQEVTKSVVLVPSCRQRFHNRATVQAGEVALQSVFLGVPFFSQIAPRVFSAATLAAVEDLLVGVVWEFEIVLSLFTHLHNTS